MWRVLRRTMPAGGIVMPGLVITLCLVGLRESKSAASRSWVSADVSHACLLERVVNVFSQELGEKASAEFVKPSWGQVEGCGILH
jgi:hypothetical protein